jgi:hypothetical protein
VNAPRSSKELAFVIRIGGVVWSNLDLGARRTEYHLNVVDRPGMRRDTLHPHQDLEGE